MGCIVAKEKDVIDDFSHVVDRQGGAKDRAGQGRKSKTRHSTIRNSRKKSSRQRNGGRHKVTPKSMEDEGEEEEEEEESEEITETTGTTHRSSKHSNRRCSLKHQHQHASPPLAHPWQITEELFACERGVSVRLVPVAAPLSLLQVGAEGCRAVEVPSGTSLEVLNTTWLHVKCNGQHSFVPAKALPGSTGLVMPPGMQIQPGQRETGDNDEPAHSSQANGSKRESSRREAGKAAAPKSGSEERLARIGCWLDQLPPAPVPCCEDKQYDSTVELTTGALAKNIQLLRSLAEVK